jgi:hypothetical protein
MKNMIILKLKLVLQSEKRIRWSSNFSLFSLKCFLHLLVVNVARHVFTVKQAFLCHAVASQRRRKPVFELHTGMPALLKNTPCGIDYERNSGI